MNEDKYHPRNAIVNFQHVSAEETLIEIVNLCGIDNVAETLGLERSLLKPEEETVLNLLGEAYNAFISIPVLHEWEQQEFMHAIHSAQRIIMARPVLREQHGERKPPPANPMRLDDWTVG